MVINRPGELRTESAASGSYWIRIQYVQIEHRRDVNSDLGNCSFSVEIGDAKHVH